MTKPPDRDSACLRALLLSEGVFLAVGSILAQAAPAGLCCTIRKVHNSDLHHGLFDRMQDSLYPRHRVSRQNNLAALFALQAGHVLDDHDTVLQLNRVNGRARLHFALAKWASHFRTSFPLASFFSSDFNLRSSFLMSSSGGRSSGRIPRPKSIDRTLELFWTCSCVIEFSP